MNGIQQYLFPEMNDNIERAREQVLEESLPADNRESFIRDIQAAITKAPSGGIVAVGCSAVANQQELIEAVLGGQPEASNLDRPAAAEIVMPPCITSSTEQSRVLFDRYSGAVAALNLHYHSDPLFSSAYSRPAPSSRSERAISTLTSHRVRIVFVKDAQNMDSVTKNLTDTNRMLRLLSDIARGSGAVHVLIGEMASLWNVVSRSSIVSQIQMVMQPLYDPEVKSDKALFLSILKKQQDNLSACTALELKSHYIDITNRTVGDYARVAVWLSDALCEAGRSGSANLQWCHMRATAPRLEQMNDAARALRAYKEFRKGTSFEFGENTAVPEIVPSKAQRRSKPFQRKPARDMVGIRGKNAA